jgi:hypothetical protein
MNEWLVINDSSNRDYPASTFDFRKNRLMIMTRWLTFDNIQRVANYESSKPWAIRYFSELGFTSTRLKELISFAPESTIDEFTEPSPCLKWWGISCDLFFELTVYLVDDEFGAITLFLPEDVETNWGALKKLMFLNEFFKTISWIKGEEKAEVSVYSVDSDNLEFELYRAKNEKDANELAAFLVGSGFEKELLIGKAQDLDFDWVAEKTSQEIARYNTKYATERYALNESKNTSDEIKVYCTDNQNYSASFVNGRKLKD